jgi:tetratricopeptide (TPR) repeat protein
MVEMSRLEQLLEFLKAEPEDEFLRYAIAMEYRASGQDERAEAMLQKLIASNPDYSASYYHLGQILQEKGEREKALSIYQDGILVTKRIGKQHHLAELQSAYNNLLYDE